MDTVHTTSAFRAHLLRDPIRDTHENHDLLTAPNTPRAYSPEEPNPSTASSILQFHSTTVNRPAGLAHIQMACTTFGYIMGAVGTQVAQNTVFHHRFHRHLHQITCAYKSVVIPGFQRRAKRCSTVARIKPRKSLYFGGALMKIFRKRPLQAPSWAPTSKSTNCPCAWEFLWHPKSERLV